VLEFLHAPLSTAETRALIERIEAGFEQRGYGWWALELPGEAQLIGFTGLNPVPADVPFAPAIEIGWRLARAYWGRGLATEAARAVATHAFDTLAVGSLVAYTARRNARSRRVMERLGMHRVHGGDFLYPRLAADDPRADSVLYRLDAGYWRIR
jgi:RimJ/RimL family protein N-acetyltransferase